MKPTFAKASKDGKKWDIGTLGNTTTAYLMCVMLASIMPYLGLASGSSESSVFAHRNKQSNV